MEKKLIEIGKQYTTRDGKAVRVLCVDCKDEEYPVLALVGEFEQVENYTADGKYYLRKSVHSQDLIEKPVERKIYLEIYTSSSWGGDEDGIIAHRTKEDLLRSTSNNNVGYTLLATKEITFTEGEFV